MGISQIRKRGSFTFVFCVFFILTISAMYLGASLMKLSVSADALRTDFYAVNQISNGFLDGKQWSVQDERILEVEIDSFQLNSKNKQVLHKQVCNIMNSLINQIDEKVHKKQKKFKDKIRMSFIRTFVDFDKVRADIPQYADLVVKEIDNATQSKEMKALMQQKIEELLLSENQSGVSLQSKVLKKYNFSSPKKFNHFVENKIQDLVSQQRALGFKLIGVMVIVLVLWIFLLKMKMKQTFTMAFIMSVLVSLVMLFIGINLPMLEIDARIAEMDLRIMHGHVKFYDQVLFYQSKSIWSVAKLLMIEGKADAIFVGVLIVLFSIVFPIAKLLSAVYWLFSKNKKEAGFIHYMAFNSGKWSMADVMVVAIFIAYIGFQSILSDQLASISTSAQQYEMLNLLTTNKSSLQIGFLIFVCFVLFNLFLAVILRAITKIEKPPRWQNLLQHSIFNIRYVKKKEVHEKKHK